MTNSSPPNRATRSSARADSRMTRATVLRTSFPTRWPAESFTALRPSRSQRTTPKMSPWRDASAISVSSRSMRLRRLRVPVRSSSRDTPERLADGVAQAQERALVEGADDEPVPGLRERHHRTVRPREQRRLARDECRQVVERELSGRREPDLVQRLKL